MSKESDEKLVDYLCSTHESATKAAKAFYEEKRRMEVRLIAIEAALVKRGIAREVLGEISK